MTEPVETLVARIRKEREAGNIVFWALEDLVAVKLDDFIKQPVDGMLYDLNRLEEVVVTFLPDPKWVNDFAVATVIRRLAAERIALQERVERCEAACRYVINDMGYKPPEMLDPALRDKYHARLSGVL